MNTYLCVQICTPEYFSKDGNLAQQSPIVPCLKHIMVEHPVKMRSYRLIAGILTVPHDDIELLCRQDVQKKVTN